MTETPQPGDFAVIDTGGRTSALLRGLEWLSDTVETNAFAKRESQWDHAAICTQVVTGPPAVRADGSVADGDTVVFIVEAERGGAREVPWHYEGRPFKWSTGVIDMSDGQRILAAETARGLADKHVGYSDLDYLALTLHSLHIPAPGLKALIGDTHRMICSQLVDYCCLQAGVHLYDDGRWPGFVKPSDLGALIC
jgi:hypothetical protein